MDFVLDLLQGAGIAAAFGIRPLLPLILVGALASANLGLDFDGTSFAFLEQWPFLVAAAVVLVAIEFGSSRVNLGYLLLAVSLVLGALFAAGSLADHDYNVAPGVVVGVAAAALGYFAALSLFTRVRAAARRRVRRRPAPVRRGRGRDVRRAVGALPAARPARARRPGLAARRRTPPVRREVRRSADPAVKKLVLVVIDAMKPAMLERVVGAGRAPTLQLLMERGQHVDDCVAAFPSVTPVCAASIATGTGPDEHEIPAMNWYHRGEGRYIEYGTSFRASQAFGIKQSLTDTIYNMNLEHLSKSVETVFERLDDARRPHRRHDVPDVPRAVPPRGVGRHRADPDRRGRYSGTPCTARGSCSTRTSSRRGARRAARSSACRAIRDQHSGCVGEYMVEHDLFDFLLFSLPDNDTHSHKNGPFAQVDSLAEADRQLARLMAPAGGAEAFLEDHAVIVCSDHSQSQRGAGDRSLPRVRRLPRAARCPRAWGGLGHRGLPELTGRAGVRARHAIAGASGCRGSPRRCSSSRASTSC